MKLSFVKACALGNDFVILNGNEIEGLSLDKFSNKIADRRYGVGVIRLFMFMKQSMQRSLK